MFFFCFATREQGGYLFGLGCVIVPGRGVLSECFVFSWFEVDGVEHLEGWSGKEHYLLINTIGFYGSSNVFQGARKD